MNNWVEIIVSILSGLAVCIPLVVQLVNSVRAAVQEKNWAKLMEMVLEMMEQAEKMFKTGADRKAWVMAGVESAALSCNYNYDAAAKEKVSEMIDSICAAAKVVN